MQRIAHWEIFVQYRLLMSAFLLGPQVRSYHKACVDHQWHDESDRWWYARSAMPWTWILALGPIEGSIDKGFHSYK